jgi:hypothetical protein
MVALPGKEYKLLVAAADLFAASHPMSHPRPLGHSASRSTESTAISRPAMCTTKSGGRGLRASRRFEETMAHGNTHSRRDDDDWHWHMHRYRHSMFVCSVGVLIIAGCLDF